MRAGPGFFSFGDILRQFADSVVRERIAVRCRIFLVNVDGVQTPFYQAGALQADGFLSVSIGDLDLDITRESTPVLCVRKGFISDLQDAGDNEFRVVRDCEEPHEVELENAYRSQWVEAPVQFEGSTAAKIVLDQSINQVDSPRRQIGKDDAFTLGELRLVARLTRQLGIVAEVAEAYRVIAGLCCAGIHGRLLWHFVRSATQVLFKLPDLPDRVKGELRGIANCLAVLRSVLARSGTSTSRAVSLTIGGEIAAAVDAIRPFSSGIRLPQVDTEQWNCPLPVADRSLFLVIVTLLENCIKYVRRVGYENNEGSVSLLICRNDQREVMIDIVDNGVGFDADEATRVRNLFQDPTLEILRKEAGALTYVAFLARELGWRLTLETERHPTTIRMIIPMHDAGGES